MVSPLLILNNSALPEKVKRQAITQEIIRVKKNTSQKVDEHEKVEQMSKISWKMWKSGYGKKGNNVGWAQRMP